MLITPHKILRKQDKKKRTTMVAVVEAGGEDFLADRRFVSPQAEGILRRLSKCGTGAFGYELHGCEDCSRMFWKGKRCKAGFCPDCGIKRSEDWRKRQEERLLPVPYDQVVIGLPNQLRVLCQENRRVLLNLHMRCSADAIQKHASSKSMYDALPSITQVLHTSDRRMRPYVHTHHLVSRGGWDSEEENFICSDAQDCPLDQALMRRLYLKQMTRTLKRLKRKGELTFNFDQNQALADEPFWKDFLLQLEDAEVYIHSTPCEGGPRQTLAYLARSQQQGVFAHIRLDRLDGTRLAWSYMNKKGGWTQCIDNVRNFLRQLVRHILPKGFNRVRYYGLNSSKGQKNLRRAAALYKQDLEDGLSVPAVHPEPTLTQPKLKTACPYCKSDNTQLLDEFPVKRVRWELGAPVPTPPLLSTFSYRILQRRLEG